MKHTTKKTLYVSDLDGTLLNTHSVVSDATTDRLNHLAEEHQLLFTIATARTPATVSQLMARINTPLPYIVMAGAALWDNAKWKYSDIHPIDNFIVGQLLDVYGAHDIHPFVYRVHGNCIYAHHVPQMSNEEQDFIAHRLRSPLKKLFTADHLSALDADEAILVYAMGEYRALRKIADEIEQKRIACTIMCYHDIFNYELGYLEIYAEGTTKAAAIQRLAKETGADRVVVFGDNLNDIPMMKAADYSVAVGNAFEEVKAFADEVIGTNDEDAVIRWIAKDIEENEKEKHG